MKNDVISTAKIVTENLALEEQYGFILNAMEKIIEWEDNKDMLAIISVQLYELHKLALEKSGHGVIHESCQCMS